MSTLRIATLNIWNKSGPWQARLEVIRHGVAALGADVIGLQEVLRLAPNGLAAFVPTSETCQATEIAEGLGYRIAYAPATSYGGGLLFGNALLSRFPILAAQGFELPHLESGEKRSLLYTLLQTPFGELPVFVTHLNWKLHHGYVRLAQVKAIAEHVAKLAPINGEALPPVLMGDFNAEPDADEIRYLRGLSVQDGKTVFFADAWLYGADGSPGATFARENVYAQQAHEPSRRIDYVFVRGPDRTFRGEPIHTRLAFHEPEPGAEGPVWPSDHYGVVTDVVFAPRQA
jgi:endonuclease/exonuclease/phosphatase family metal-dependent hydrolase